MERIRLAGLQADVSALGFGCASLGSRVGAQAGQRLLAEALDCGIDWFDLAPAYGGGAAETIFAEALAHRRGSLHICTKVGLLPPPQPAWKRAIMPVARSMVGMIKPLRAKIRRSGVTGNRAITLTPQLLRESLEQSLVRLRTDHVDLYALHNATPAALGDDAILRTLEDLRASGKTRAIAVASDQTAARLAMQANGVFDVAQMALADITPEIRQQAAASGMGLIAHSVFGVDAALAKAQARLARDPDLARRLEASGLKSAADALLLQARLRNPQGIILCSMVSPANLRANTKLFAGDYDATAQGLVQQLFDDQA